MTAVPVETPASAEPRPFFRSLAWLTFLSPFFFWTYTWANAVTARRAHVPFVVFGWERHIPFWPWTIIPYWTSDFLYGISVLICTTRRELDLHARRLIAIQLISVASFLAFPLQCIFVRPATTGLLGWMFHFLMSFDRPFNQAPSLHVSLAVILWSRFSAHSRGFWRVLIASWLILIGISTITTYQHQFLDLPTGLLAGSLTLALFPEASVAARAQRLRIATFYLSGATLLTAVALKMGGLLWVSIWPSFALLLVAIAYLTNCPGVFRPRSVALRAVIEMVTAPYSLAAWINSRWWTRNDAGPQEIADGVFIGRAPGHFDKNPAVFPSIVDLTSELHIHADKAKIRTIPVLDLTTPTRQQLETAASAIEGFRSDRPTLVCCALGFSRSAAAIAAWLVWSGRARSADEAISRIGARRRGIVLHPTISTLIDDHERTERERRL